MPTTKNPKRKIIDKLLTSFGVVAVLVLAGIGGLAWWAYSFTSGNVHDELAAQKIYFPSTGSPAFKALPATDQTAINKYAGQQLLTGAQAKAYANHFIAVHLSEIAGGKTYAQASSESQANPNNAQLKQESQTLFQGETLRGLLLGDAYAFSTVARIAQIAAIVCFAAAGVMAFLVILGLWHMTTV